MRVPALTSRSMIFCSIRFTVFCWSLMRSASLLPSSCPYTLTLLCRTRAQDSEELFVPVSNSAGALIGGAVPVVGTDGALTLEPARIPAYRPDRYPLVLQRSVSVYGQLLGNSDADLIKDHGAHAAAPRLVVGQVLQFDIIDPTVEIHAAPVVFGISHILCHGVFAREEGRASRGDH